MKNKDKPAYPMKEIYHTGLVKDGEPVLGESVNEGLSKREWLAGMAMNSIYAEETDSVNDIAECAVSIADALLAELDKESGE